MTGLVVPPSNDFERAFVATSYLLGLRGEDLIAPLQTAGEAARRLALRLNDPDRTRRAQVLAPELGRLVQALDARRLR